MLLSGNWKFISCLPIAVDLRVGVSNEGGEFNDHGCHNILYPGKQMTSILAPDGAVSEMILKIVEGKAWSITYPLPGSDTGWKKPRILIEVCNGRNTNIAKIYEIS